MPLFSERHSFLKGTQERSRISFFFQSAPPCFSPTLGVRLDLKPTHCPQGLHMETIPMAGLRDNTPNRSTSIDAFSHGSPQVGIQISKHQKAVVRRSSRRHTSYLSDAFHYPHHLFRISKAGNSHSCTKREKRQQL